MGMAKHVILCLQSPPDWRSTKSKGPGDRSELRQCRQCCLDVTVSRCHMVWSSQLDRCHFKRHQNHLHYGAFFKIKSSCVDVCEMKHKCTFLKEILTKTNWNHFEYKYVVYMLKCLPERSFFFAFKLNGKQWYRSVIVVLNWRGLL